MWPLQGLTTRSHSQRRVYADLLVGTALGESEEFRFEFVSECGNKLVKTLKSVYTMYVFAVTCWPHCSSSMLFAPHMATRTTML